MHGSKFICRYMAITLRMLLLLPYKVAHMELDAVAFRLNNLTGKGGYTSCLCSNHC